ncbi:hypothetical protein OIU85_000916 [Salix viminalis]|uniref:Uncharacterized protein n=1 Tax=Salix viminalis TaxID=40686 RepID=A0A9Q0ZX86_SALVM|nr:hypothetical protein OIU85_000916 [Salix viminalis]
MGFDCLYPLRQLFSINKRRWIHRNRPAHSLTERSEILLNGTGFFSAIHQSEMQGFCYLLLALCSARQGFSLQDKQGKNGSNYDWRPDCTKLEFLCFLHRNRYGNTGPAHMATKSSHEAQSKKREKRDGRENLLGFGDETKHRSRNLKEIVSKYRKSKDPSSLAMSAKNKLVQRQEKLDKLSNQAEELEGTSEDYASMTNELLKKNWRNENGGKYDKDNIGLMCWQSDTFSGFPFRLLAPLCTARFIQTPAGDYYTPKMILGCTNKRSCPPTSQSPIP